MFRTRRPTWQFLSMIQTFFKFEINLELYQYQEIPQTIVPYEKRFERSLSTEIKRFQAELNWKDMWTIPEVYSRLDKGYRFWVYRPKNQIKGWGWLSPEGEVKNLYVSKWSRNQGICQKIILQTLNGALDSDMDSVFARVDVWNTSSLKAFERVLEIIGCKSSIKIIEEEYGK